MKRQNIMRQFLLGLTVSLILTMSQSKGQIMFQKCYGDTGWWGSLAWSIDNTFDKGYVLAGENSFNNIYLIKVDSIGNVLWNKTFGTISTGKAYCVKQTSDSGLIMVGYSNGGLGSDDVAVIRTDNNGNIIWAKNYGGTSQEAGYNIIETTNSDFVIVGYTQSFGAGQMDIYLLRINSAGNLLWTKTFGNSNSESGVSVQESSTGYLYISVYSAWINDNVIIKTDYNGNLIWSKSFGTAGNETSYSNLISNDNLLVTGHCDTASSGNVAPFLLKIDSLGNIIFVKTYYGFNGYGKYIAKTNDNGFTIANDNSLGKIDSLGNFLWGKRIVIVSPYSETITCAKESNNGFIIGGYSNACTDSTSSCFLVKTNLTGQSACIDSSFSITQVSPIFSMNNFPISVGTGGSIINKIYTVGNGIIQYDICSNTGINDILIQKSFIIYPNPFSSQTILQTDILLENATLTVNNCFGQTIKEIKNISGQTIILYRDNLPSGLYFIRLTEDNKVIATNKLVITD